jgi:hypothetical protein
MRKSRSILEELNSIAKQRDAHHVFENRGGHIIESAINLIIQIEEQYDETTAKDLTNRLINSIKGRDANKFSRGIRKVIKENQARDES